MKQIVVRVPPSSDFLSWQQVFGQKQYEPVLNLIDSEHPVTLDFGANIGMASRYFQEQLPNARIFAIELDPENYEVLKLNWDGYSINAGVWSKNCGLGIGRDFMDTKEWSYYAKEGGEIPGFTVRSFMKFLRLEHVDLMKMDIEGGEFEVFKDDSFLEHVGAVAIEVHETLGDRQIIVDSLRKYDFQLVQSGELLLGKK